MFVHSRDIVPRFLLLFLRIVGNLMYNATRFKTILEGSR